MRLKKKNRIFKSDFVAKKKLEFYQKQYITINKTQSVTLKPDNRKSIFGTRLFF